MDPNIYKAPQSDLESEDRSPGSLIKAVGLGLLVDLGGTMIASFAVGLAWATTHAGISADELNRAMMTPGTGLYGTMIALGLLMTVLGGYVCASIARRRDFKAPAVQGLILLGMGALGSSSLPMHLLLSMNIGTVLAVMGGAWLRIRRIQPRTPPAA